MNYRYDTLENRFTSASMALGVFSILTSFTGVLPAVLGGLGVLLVVIGHRRNQQKTPAEILGFLSSFTGLAIGMYLTITTVVTIIIPYYTDPDAFAKVNEMYKAYGVDLGELLSTMPY